MDAVTKEIQGPWCMWFADGIVSVGEKLIKDGRGLAVEEKGLIEVRRSV